LWGGHLARPTQCIDTFTKFLTTQLITYKL
jgi:hypothetical protein